MAVEVWRPAWVDWRARWMLFAPSCWIGHCAPLGWKGRVGLQEQRIKKGAFEILGTARKKCSWKRGGMWRTSLGDVG